MNKNETRKYDRIVEPLFTMLWALTLIVTILFLLNPYCIHTFTIRPNEENLFPINLDDTYIYISLFFLEINQVVDTNNILLISLYVMFMFYVAVALIIVIVYKYSFVNSNNKLNKAIQYLLVSILALTIGVIVYLRGTFLDMDAIKNDDGENTLVFYYKRPLSAIIFGAILIILDIPYLILGIKEYKLNKNNRQKLSFKEKFIIFFKDWQNILLILLLVITPIIYMIAYINNGGINFNDAINKVFID